MKYLSISHPPAVIAIKSHDSSMIKFGSMWKCFVHTENLFTASSVFPNSLFLSTLSSSYFWLLSKSSFKSFGFFISPELTLRSASLVWLWGSAKRHGSVFGGRIHSCFPLTSLTHEIEFEGWKRKGFCFCRLLFIRLCSLNIVIAVCYLRELGINL